MALLATLIADSNGICDIYAQTTYGAGMVPCDCHGDLAFSVVLNEPLVPYTRATYERCVMLITGGFAD